MPGVTYERAVQFTSHGPVALHVVVGPRPTGLYALRPVLSNETIAGTERVTAMQKRLSAGATMVGVNGDFFNLGTGRPSGVLLRDGIVDSPPYGDRSSVGLAADGTLDVRRIEFFGTWRGLGQRRAINDLNQLPGPNGVSLFTPSYGPATPAQAGAVAAVIAPFPPATPNTDLAGPVIQLAGGGTPIPAGGAVLLARGTAAQRLTEESPVGTTLALRIIFRPDWTGITQAIGGGPVLVRDRKPVFRALEAFSADQLVPRTPRTAVGQLADGRILFVATDGRQPGYSVGMTNFELAQTLVRLGAVTGSAFDAGGSTTLAFDGTLLNRPSDPRGERDVSTSLQLMYYGVYVPRGRTGRLTERRRRRREPETRLQGRPALDRDGDADGARRGGRVLGERRADARHVPRRRSRRRRSIRQRPCFRPPRGRGGSTSRRPTTRGRPRRRGRRSRSTTRSAPFASRPPASSPGSAAPAASRRAST